MPVLDPVLERGLAVEVGPGREQDGAVLEKLRAAAAHPANGGHRHRLAVMLDVVGDEPVGPDDDRVVLADRRTGLGGLEPVVGEIRRVVDRGDV